MSLVRTFYDPFAEFDKLFDDAFNVRNTALIHRRDRGFPRMDLHENAQTKRVTATFETPRCQTKMKSNVEVHGNRLTISGESKRSENYNYVVQERSFGKFSRTFQIPQGINVEDVHAKMENGVLTQPQRIAIA
ncbi:HSP20-like chaperone [Suillus spraguei]|nr:HSP20-like chaperone [Suillus spraguei]